MFSALLSLIECDRIRTTPYHFASNGIIERWHRVLKAAIMCLTDKDWAYVLPTVLFGLCGHVRANVKASSAEFLVGTTLRLPDELFLPEDSTPDGFSGTHTGGRTRLQSCGERVSAPDTSTDSPGLATASQEPAAMR